MSQFLCVFEILTTPGSLSRSLDPRCNTLSHQRAQTSRRGESHAWRRALRRRAAAPQTILLPHQFDEIFSPSLAATLAAPAGAQNFLHHRFRRVGAFRRCCSPLGPRARSQPLPCMERVRAGLETVFPSLERNSPSNYTFRRNPATNANVKPPRNGQSRTLDDLFSFFLRRIQVAQRLLVVCMYRFKSVAANGHASSAISTAFRPSVSHPETGTIYIYHCVQKSSGMIG